MKVFFLLPELEWMFAGDEFRRQGYEAPSWAHAANLAELNLRLPMYKASIVIAHSALVRDGIDQFLRDRFPHLPVLKFTFDPVAIRYHGYGWYPQQVTAFLERSRAKTPTK